LKWNRFFEKYGKNSDLEVYGVHDKGDMEYDKIIFPVELM
jgi:hypothetical protein